MFRLYLVRDVDITLYDYKKILDAHKVRFGEYPSMGHENGFRTAYLSFPSEILAVEFKLRYL